MNFVDNILLDDIVSFVGNSFSFLPVCLFRSPVGSNLRAVKLLELTYLVDEYGAYLSFFLLNLFVNLSPTYENISRQQDTLEDIQHLASDNTSLSDPVSWCSFRFCDREWGR